MLESFEMLRGRSPHSLLLASAAFGLMVACSSSADGDGGKGGQGGKPEEIVPLPDVTGVALAEDINPDPHVLEVNLAARARMVPLADGPETAMLNYNDQLPGPLLHARV